MPMELANIPGDAWKVNDPDRPQPVIVTPGDAVTRPAVTPPSDAIVLFDGSTTDEWVAIKDGSACPWTIDDDTLLVLPRTSGILSKRHFGDCQLHIEFSCPTEITADGQGRGNSGVFLMNNYEVQVLDSYDNPTYADGLCGAMYGQNPPLVNACAKPGEWNIYDIIWKAPTFEGDALVTPPYITVIHNGVLIQNHYELKGRTTHKQWIGWKAHPAKGPIQLQDHGDPVRFRNIWVREL